MTTTRIRRTRPSPVVESAPVRVRRVRAAPVPAPVRRVPRRAVPSLEDRVNSLPLFSINWAGSLGYKLQIYMLNSFLYYERSKSIITDHDFDRLCNDLAKGWDTFEHQHKRYTDKESMLAGTGYANDYPLIVRSAAETVLREFREI